MTQGAVKRPSTDEKFILTVTAVQRRYYFFSACFNFTRNGKGAVRHNLMFHRKAGGIIKFYLQIKPYSLTKPCNVIKTPLK